MAEYNLGTASGRIEVDGSGAELGFRAAQIAGQAFFDGIRSQVEEVQQLGRRLAAVGTAGVAGFGVAVKAASGFEQQMSGVFAVANATEEQMERLRQKALDLGSDTVYSATESAQAMEELLKAGIGIEEVLNGAAAATVALAAAGGVSLPEAATIAANAMNQFEIEAKNLPKVADILAGVANTSAADVSSLGQSLSQAGAIANLSGMSFRDTAIALGEMADAGIQGSDAGTSLKTMFNNLQPVTMDQSNKFKELEILTYSLKDAQKALKAEGLEPVKGGIDEVKASLADYIDELGKGEKGTQRNAREVDKLLMQYGGLNNAFFDAKGNIKDLGGIQRVLGKALEGQTKQQKLANLELLFGADAMRASAILSLAGAKGYKEFSKAVAGVSAAEVAETRLDNLAGAVEQFKGSFETALITIGNIFLPVITAIVQGATKLVNMFNDLPASVQKAVAIFVLISSAGMILIGAFLALLPVIAGFIANMLLMRGITAIGSVFVTFFKVLRSGAGVVAAGGAALGRMGKIGAIVVKRLTLLWRVVKLLRFAWIALTGPIGIAIAAVLGLVALGVLLYKKWAPFRNLVDRIASALRDRLVAAWNAIQPVIESGIATFQKFVGFVTATILPVLKSVGQMLLGTLLSGWRKVSEQVMSSLVPALQRLGELFTGTVIPAVQKVWGFMQPLIMGFLKFAAVVGGVLLVGLMKFGDIFISYILPALIKVAGFLINVLIQAVIDFVSGIIQAVSGIISIFSGLINFFAGLFTGNWSRMWDGIKQIFTGIWDTIIGLAKAYLAVGLMKIAMLGLRLLRAIIRGGWNVILAIIRGAGTRIWNFVKSVWNFIVNIVRGAGRMVVNVVRAAWNLVRSIISNVMRFVLNLLRGIWNSIVGLVRGSTGNVKDLIRKAWEAVQKATGKAWDKVLSAIKDTVSKVLDRVRQIPGDIKSAIGNLGGLLYNVGMDIIRGLINGIGAMKDQLMGAAKSVAKSALDAAKGALGIGSPSKEFKLIGVWSGDGMIRGFEDANKSVARSAVTMASLFLRNFSASMEPVAFMATSSLDKMPASLDVAAPRGRVKKRNPGRESKASRMVSGTLGIDHSGKAWIKGIAEDVVDGNDRFDTTHRRQRKP